MYFGKSVIAARFKMLAMVALLLISITACAEPMKVMVMVSSSMPESSLKQFAKQAKALQAPLVIRGLVNDSLPDTVKFFSHYLDEPMKSIVIDPEAFDEYEIDKVPTVVVIKGTRFDKVSGSSSMSTALGRIKNRHPSWTGIDFMCDKIGGCNHHVSFHVHRMDPLLDY